MILDSLDQMQELDKQGVYLSITSLADQMGEAWNVMADMDLPPDFKIAKNVVICGMGGSALAGRALKSLFGSKFRVPVEVRTNYSLPGYADSNTLVILSSYSGNTEETISSAEEAKSRGCMMFGMTAGGKLKDFLKDNELPAYIFDTKYNPSGQPRMSLGYSIVATIALLSKISVISLDPSEMADAIEAVNHFIDLFSARENASSNIAKELAEKFQGKIPVLISSNHLFGITHAFKNQLNENAKIFSIYFAIPELNHHLLEGLKFPSNAKNMLYFLFITSDLYSDRIKLRYPVTQEVVQKQGYDYSVYNLDSQTRMKQVFELLTLGSYVSFYLAMLEGIDPSPIPWVDYFKQKLV